MIALYVQILLLTAAAYFVGAAIACVVRRSFHSTARPGPVAARPVEPLPEMMQRAAGAARFPRGTERDSSGATAAAGIGACSPRRDFSSAGTGTGPQAVRLIDAALEGGLSKLGSHRYEQIAAWMQPDVKRVSEALGQKGRVTGRTGSSRRRCSPRAASRIMPARDPRRDCQGRPDTRRGRAAHRPRRLRHLR